MNAILAKVTNQLYPIENDVIASRLS